jgi:proteasome assembly chaperone (PAC2) family protein
MNIKLDLTGLEGEINRTNEIIEKMREIEEQRETCAHKIRRMEEERITYIS